MKMVCGIDEAGRGALAGPLVAAAVVLSSSDEYTVKKSGLMLRDSKLLSKGKRERVYAFLVRHNFSFKTEVISARRINNRGIQRANRECIKELIRKIEADHYIVDGKIRLGRVKGKTLKIKTIVDADATILPVILAGIVAKVERDAIMTELHTKFPQYGWIHNSGYGTTLHIEALKIHRMCRYHRSIYVTSALRKNV